MTNKSYIVFLLFVFVWNISYTQTITNELWTELGVVTDIANNVSADVVIEARFQEIGPSLKFISGEFGFSYKVSKPISIGISYKCTEKNRPQGFFSSHTGAVALSYKQKFGNVRVAYRNKFETSRDMYTNEITDLYPTFEDRNRLKVSYSRKKALISPSVSVETFHGLNNPDMFTLSEIRYTCGVDFNLKKKIEAGIAYSYKQTFGKPTNTSVYSISIAKGF